MDFSHKTVCVQGRYCQIQKRIGEGSHATVWLARERVYPHQEIIVKIARDTSGVAYERVQNEIWFLREIKHPNIPEFLGDGSIDEHIWLAMPVYGSLHIPLSLKGQVKRIPVSDIRPEGYPRLARRVPPALKERLAVRVLSDIGQVIAYIAGTGIVHADISPGNIMEKQASVMNQQYVLTDWGACALIHRYPETAFGSLHFTAPERLLGEVGCKSDLFSLGITCFYILTGTVPFFGQTGESYYASVADRDGIAPSVAAPKISAALDRIVRDMIRHRVEDRPEPEEICRRAEKLRQSLE